MTAFTPSKNKTTKSSASSGASTDTVFVLTLGKLISSLIASVFQAAVASGVLCFVFDGLSRRALDLPYIGFWAFFGLAYTITWLLFFISYGWQSGKFSAKVHQASYITQNNQNA